MALYLELSRPLANMLLPRLTSWASANPLQSVCCCLLRQRGFNVNLALTTAGEHTLHNNAPENRTNQDIMSIKQGTITPNKINSVDWLRQREREQTQLPDWTWLRLCGFCIGSCKKQKNKKQKNTSVNHLNWLCVEISQFRPPFFCELTPFLSNNVPSLRSLIWKTT